ncbi:MAG: NUDIX domain-containing protein [Balneolaceae bacterium]
MSVKDPYSDHIRVRVSALILQKNHLLVVKQNTPSRAEHIWLPPGGGLDFGETTEEALRREVFEETSIEIKNGRIRYIHEFIEPPYHAVELYFLVESFTGTPTLGSDPELSFDHQQLTEVKFVPVPELMSMNLYPEFLKEALVNGTVCDESISHFKS